MTSIRAVRRAGALVAGALAIAAPAVVAGPAGAAARPLMHAAESHPVVAVASSGHAVVVTRRTAGSSGRVAGAPVARVRGTAGRPWSAPVRLAPASQRADGAWVAVNEPRGAVALWRADGRLHAARWARGRWSRPRPIGVSGTTADPLVRLADDGTARVIVPQCPRAAGPCAGVRIVEQRPGGRWRRTSDLPLPPASMLAVDMNRRGDAVAVVARNDEPAVEVLSRPPRGAWSAPQRLVSSPRAWVAAGVGPRGHAAVAVVPYDRAWWEPEEPAGQPVMLVATRPGPVGGWSAPEAVLATQALWAGPALAVDERGGVLAAVNRLPPGPNGLSAVEVIATRVRGGGAAWGPVTEVAREDPGGGNNIGAAQPVLARGRAFLTWARVGHGGVRELWLSRLAGGRWRPVTSGAGVGSGHAVAQNGRAISVVDPRPDWRSDRPWRLRVVDVPPR